MPAKSAEYYLSIPSYIPPTSFDAGVPTNGGGKPTDAPAVSPISADGTPSPAAEPVNPWDPQLNQSIKVESPIPKSPRSRSAKFAPAAPSSGAAGFQRHRSPQPPSQQPPVSDTTTQSSSATPSPSTPASALASMPSSLKSADSKPSRSQSSGSTLTKSLARLSKSISLRTRTNSSAKPAEHVSLPPPPPVPPLPTASPQSASASAAPEANASQPATPGRRFVIPQTLEEWEAFNRAILARGPPSPSPNHGLAPPRRPFAPGGPGSGRSRPNSIVGAGTPGSSNPASPNGSPRRRPLPELPPPPIVQADWERRRSWSQFSKIQQPLPPTSRPSSRPNSRPSSPVQSHTPPLQPLAQPRPTAARRISAPTSASQSTVSLPRLANGTATPPPGLPVGVPARARSPLPAVPIPAPLETPAPTEPAVTPKEEPSVISAAPLRLRTTSLPSSSNPQRPQLSPIDTSLPSPSLKWKRPMSWVGRAPSNKSDSKPAVVAAPVPRPSSAAAAAAHASRARRASVSESVIADAVRRGSIEVERDTMSNGARLRARRKSSQDFQPHNTLKKRRPSEDLNASQVALHVKAATYSSASTTDLLSGPAKRPPLKHSSTDVPSPDRKSRRLSVMGMLGIASKRGSQVNLAAVAPPPPGTRNSSLDGPQASIPSNLDVRPSQDSAQPSNAGTSSSPLVAKPDLPTPAAEPTHRKRRSSFTQLFNGSMTSLRLRRKESTESMISALKAPQPQRPAGLMLHVPGPTAGSMSDTLPPMEAHLVASPLSGPTPTETKTTPTEAKKTPTPAEGKAATPRESAETPKTERRRSRRMSWTQAAFNLFRKDSSSGEGSGSASASATKPRPATPLALPVGLAAPQIPGHSAPLTPAATLSRNSSFGADEIMRHAKASTEASETKSFRMSWRKKPAQIDTAVDDRAVEISPTQRERIERMSTPVNLPSPTLEMGDKSIPVGVFKTGGTMEHTVSVDHDDSDEQIDHRSNRVSRFLSDLAASSTNELGLRVGSPALEGNDGANGSPKSSEDASASVQKPLAELEV